MKKIFLTSLLFWSFLFIQAQVRPTKPTIMVMPSKSWCNAKGYTTKIINQGTTSIECDYQAALLDPNMNTVITEIGELFQKYGGFELKLLGATLDRLKEDAAYDLAITSKSGESVTESPLDKLLKTAKPDIILELYYVVNTVGGVKNSVEFRLTSIDAYTSKQIGNANGNGEESYETVHSKLLVEAVHSYVTNLANQMQGHFDEQLLNGREINMAIKVFEGNDFDLDDEVAGVTYEHIIKEWLRANTVNKAFKVDQQTENQMKISEVRIPMYNDKGDPIMADDFAKGLQKLLKEKSGTKVKKQSLGIGLVWLILGNS